NRLPTRSAAALSGRSAAPFQGLSPRRAGKPPAGPEQVMIDRASARQGHFAPGDRIEIEIGGQALAFTVSGVTGYGSADSIGGGSMAIFSVPTAQRLFGLTGRYSQIDVKAAPRVSAPQLRARVAEILPPGVEAAPRARAPATP